MSDDHAEWFLVGLNSKFLVSPVALFQLFSLKCISRNDRVTNQNAKPVAVAAVEDCRSDSVVATVEVTELNGVETGNRKSGRGTTSMEVCGMEPTTVDAAASKVAVESSQNWNSLLVALVAD